MQNKQKSIDAIRTEMDSTKDKSSKEFKALEDKMKKESDEIISYRMSLMKQNPNTFVTKMFKAMKDVELHPRDQGRLQRRQVEIAKQRSAGAFTKADDRFLDLYLRENAGDPGWYVSLFDEAGDFSVAHYDGKGVVDGLT